MIRSLRDNWGGFLLRALGAFVALVALWTFAAPGYASLLATVAGPFAGMVAKAPVSLRAAGPTVAAAPAQAPRPPSAAAVQGDVWSARYHGALLLALILATPRWSLATRGAALGSALVVLFVGDLAALLVTVARTAGPIRGRAAGSLGGLGQVLSVLFVYGGLVVWTATRERAARLAAVAATLPAEEESGRRIVTVMFTDIVGATERAVSLGDRRWRDILERHHVLVRTELARFGGREIDNAGDGFLATFDSPARAIRCASAVGDAVRQLGIEIRAGLHTGEVEQIGPKVGGVAVHIGARVAAQAGASEVMVTRTVADLLAGSGIRFEDRGVRALKGIQGQWQLYAVDRGPSARTAPEERLAAGGPGAPGVSERPGRAEAAAPAAAEPPVAGPPTADAPGAPGEPAARGPGDEPPSASEPAKEN